MPGMLQAGRVMLIFQQVGELEILSLIGHKLYLIVLECEVEEEMSASKIWNNPGYFMLWKIVKGV